jgi:VanZ family protein
MILPRLHSKTSNFVLVLWLISIAAVSYLSLKPKVEFPIDFEKSDLVYHGAAYLWLSVLPFLGLRRKKTGLVCALLMFPLGAGLEFAQLAVPGRTFSAMDIGANALGVILGILLYGFSRSRSRSFRPST